MKRAFLLRFLHVTAAVVFGLMFPSEPMLASMAAPPADVVAHTSETPIEFWNREIVMLRGTLVNSSSHDRAERAVQRLQELPLNARANDLVLHRLTVEGQDGVAFSYHGRILFFLGASDLDKESGETLDQVQQSALRNLDEALEAREAERRWPVIRTGLFLLFSGLLVLLFVIILIWRIHGWLEANLLDRNQHFRRQVRLFGQDILPYIATGARSLLRTIAWLLTLAAIYTWLASSLRRFPYTQPWGDQLGTYVIVLLQQFGRATIHALPGILEVFVILLIARWVILLGRAFFHQVTTGKLQISWMDADIAQATQRIFSALVWIFAMVVAYPYIPGSNTEAFKGISVFVGLVISLGSSGIINQVISGLFVVYSRALKSGEWVRINEIEGEVLEVGPLATKIRTIEGQVVTVPNAVMVGTLTTNYTRLGYGDGMVASTTVSIGYDVPWRQVHALLMLAAERTINVRKQPEPYVLQRQLSDFYPAYTIIVRLVDEKLRIETLSRLHSNIQDAFNEFGVQIMSPHFMIQPEHRVVVPRSKWHEPPSAPSLEQDVVEKPIGSESEK